jgi:hypothetical protein
MQIAVGVRGYWRQRAYLNSADEKKSHYSIGPNVEIKKQFLSKSVLAISGWYEKQVIDENVKYIPNFKLNCIIKI